MSRLTRAPAPPLVFVAAAVACLAGSGRALAGVPRPKPPSAAVRAATASAQRALLRRPDLGAGWSSVSAAPARAASLTCSADHSVLAAAASATWSQRSADVFASGTSYGYTGVAAERRAWQRTGSGGMGPCLERLLAAGSGRGVRLTASGVRRLGGPKLGSGAHGAAVRRYRVSGVASGNGQQTSVALDVVLVAAGSWIAEDEFTAAQTSPADALEARVVGAQARRAIGSSAH